MTKNILCTICVRGGSKGVKNKNIREICGKPLIAWTIEQARECGLFDHVVISSDSEKILEIAEKHGGDVFFKRPDELATDTAGKLDVIRHAHLCAEKEYGTVFDHHIDLDATSPLRTVDDIIKAYSLFTEKGYDNLITAAPSHRSPYFNLVEVVDGKVKLCREGAYLRRQDTPRTYDMNASIYIWKRKTLLEEKTLFLENTGLYIMPQERSIDIDSPLDFTFVEFIMERGLNHAEK